MRRVVIPGIGGHIGTAVARLLHDDPELNILGIDIEPPRRHLDNTDFLRIAPGRGQHQRVVDSIIEFDPTEIMHLGVYEPHARSNPVAATSRTLRTTELVLRAADRCRSLEHVTVRSGIEVYGRRRGTPLRPSEEVARDPTTRFGRSLDELERRVTDFGAARGIPVGIVRCAPIVAPHVPSPLGRYLRLPVVPVPLVPAPVFCLVHLDDAAAAFVAAAYRRFDGAVNVAGSGAVTAHEAVRVGSRIPAPVLGPAWEIAGLGTGVFGAPLPDHVRELLTRGRGADLGRIEAALGSGPRYSTVEVLKDLYEWAPVTYLRESGAA